MTGGDQNERSDLDRLGDKIAKARGDEPNAGNASGPAPGAHDGLRVAIEFVVSVLVGTGLGFTIGSFFEAPTVGTLIGLPLGFAAGLRTVYRGMTASAGAATERDVPDGND